MATASKCEWCGLIFEHRRTQKRRCCSQHCSAKLRHTERVAAGTYKRPKKPRRGDIIKCEICRTEVYRQPAAIKRNQRYCSRDCHNVGQTKPVTVKQCKNCGKELQLKPSQSRIQFCSKVCDGDSRVKRPLDRMHNGKAAKKDDAGYVMIYEPSHPNKSQKGWQYEHRVIAEATVGRFLASDEHVHHLNGIKDDNRPNNLQVLGQNEHAAISSREYFESIKKMRDELAEYKSKFGEL